MSRAAALIERLAGLRAVAGPDPASARDALTALDRLRTLVSAGMPPGDALRFGAAAGGPVAARLTRASSLVERGSAFSRALAQAGVVLSEPDLALLRAGEASGSMGETLALLCERVHQRTAAKSQVSRALAYPCALLAVTLAVVLAMTTLVLPSFVALYATTSAAMPATTRGLLAFGAAVKSHGASAVFGAVIVVSVFRWSIGRSPRARATFDRALVRTPFVGPLVISRARADFYATLACLLRAGVDLETAVASTAATVGNAAIRSKATALVRSLRRGAALSVCVERSGFDENQRDAALLRLGEAIGDYAGTCARISSLEAEENASALQRLARVVEPAVLLVMAVVVSAAALAIYQPVLGSAALLMGGSQ